MQQILQSINAVEGVIGSAVFSQRGRVLVHAFPALIDKATLNKAAALTLECAHGLQIAQTLDIIDLRFSDGRIIIKAFPGAMLCLLCAKNINLQVLAITLNLAAKRLEAELPNHMDTPEEVPVEPAEADDGFLKLPVGHLANKSASSSFDSLGMIAVSQPTSKFISDYYKAPFKKLVLANAAAGVSGTFPVMVMNEMDAIYDGLIIVGPGIEKKLKVTEGDKVVVKTA